MDECCICHCNVERGCSNTPYPLENISNITNELLCGNCYVKYLVRYRIMEELDKKSYYPKKDESGVWRLVKDNYDTDYDIMKDMSMLEKVSYMDATIYNNN